MRRTCVGRGVLRQAGVQNQNVETGDGHNFSVVRRVPNRIALARELCQRMGGPVRTKAHGAYCPGRQTTATDCTIATEPVAGQGALAWQYSFAVASSAGAASGKV